METKEMIIKAKNKRGQKAIAIQKEEYRKLGFKERMLMKSLGYRIEVISDESFKFIMQNRLISNPMFIDMLKKEVMKALLENGASEKDISITVR